jgi:hypothetical protein
MNQSITFKSLELECNPSSAEIDGTSPLERWYNSVANQAICTFSIADTCKSLRQQIFPQAIVPHAIELLQINHLAGNMYDGELLASLYYVNNKYWVDHMHDGDAILHIAISAMPRLEGDCRFKVIALISLLKPLICGLGHT